MAVKFFVFSILLIIVAGQNPNPIVKLPYGSLQGTWKVSASGRPYASFQGVPYARPPVGKYRFKEPQPLKPWTGVWDATKTLTDCLQYEPISKSVYGSENCLFANVYTPNLSPSANLPVMVFIHGGAFMYGSGSLYDTLHVMDKDMIVVTFNYRLGPLGFLSTGDEVIPGNMGLKDQSFALHWVKNNIMLFGGNPDSITLTGLSAGGASVHYHYLSPLSKDTFARGIAFSGAAFNSWAHAVKPAQKAKTLASIVGCPTETSREILDCLKYRPAEVIVNAQIEMFEWKVHMFTPFTPTVEAPNVKEPFLNQYPYHAAMNGAMHRVPLMTSFTSEEGLYPAAYYQTEPSMLDELESGWEQLASNIFEYNDTLPLRRRADVAADIKRHYLRDQPVSQDTYPQLVQALGDRLFVAEIGKLAEIHAAKSGQPTYLYKFSYRGKVSLTLLMANNNENYGVSHGDDVLSLLKFPGLEDKSAEDLVMIKQLVDMIYTYSTTGTPKLCESCPAWSPVKVGAKEIEYLEISSPTNISMRSSSDIGQRTFWDSLGFIENQNFHLSIRDEL